MEEHHEEQALQPTMATPSTDALHTNVKSTLPLDLPKWTPINDPITNPSYTPYTPPPHPRPHLAAPPAAPPAADDDDEHEYNSGPSPSTTVGASAANKANGTSAGMPDDEELLSLAADHSYSGLAEILKVLYPGIAASQTTMKRYVDNALQRRAEAEGRSFEVVRREFSEMKVERRRQAGGKSKEI